MDIRKNLEQLDIMYGEGRLKDAENCLDSWLSEAEREGNYGAMLTLYNEMEGLYRTTGRAQKGAEISDKALALIEKMGLWSTVHHATTLQNGATANRVAGNLDKALGMYLETAEIYKKHGYENSYPMASLHNNISHIYQEKKDYNKALHHLEGAYRLITRMKDSEAEVATTEINMALTLMMLGRENEAEKLLFKALQYYQSDIGKGDGHYGSALSAAAEFYWRKKDFDSAISCYQKALDITLKIFGENDGCRIIRSNIERVKKDKNNQNGENI